MTRTPLRGFSSLLVIALVALLGFGAYAAYKGDLSSMLAAVTGSRSGNPTAEVDASETTTGTSNTTGTSGTSASASAAPVSVTSATVISPTLLTIIAPNGGETIVASKPTLIKWKVVGQTNPTSIALYKNGVFLTWITSSLSTDKNLGDTYSYSWTPKETFAGSGYQIVISAPKASGGGTMTDKSDATFSIIAQDIRPTLPDLTASAITSVTSTTGTMGQVVRIAAIVSNIGTGASATSSQVAFQTATATNASAAKTVALGTVGPLAIGGSASTTASYTLPQGTTPARFVRACADMGTSGAGTITELNENNNCGAWTDGALPTSISVEGHSTAQALTYNAAKVTSSYGTFTIRFDVTAAYGDVYIPKTVGITGAQIVSPVLPSTGVFVRAAIDSLVGTSTGAVASSTLTTTADSANTNYYVVHAGNTETFTVTTIINPSGFDSTVRSTYHVGLDKLRFSLTNTNPTSLQTVEVDETNSNFRTDPLTIPG